MEDNAIERLKKNLAHYRKKRENHPLYVLKDKFRNNVRDPNSLSNRFNMVDDLLESIKDTDKLLEKMLTAAEQITDQDSRLRKIILDYFQPIYAEANSGEKLKHFSARYHKLLLNDILAKREKALQDIVIKPSRNWAERIRNFFKPKPKNTELQIIQALKKKVSEMKDEEVINNINNIKSARSVQNVYDILSRPVVSVGPIEKRNQKISYFTGKFVERFNAHMLGDIVGSTGKFLYMPRDVAVAGIALFSIIPGGSTGCSIIRAIHGAEELININNDSVISAQISLDDINHKLANKIAEKLAFRYANQIALLYHDTHSKESINKLVHAMVKNALSNLNKADRETFIEPKLLEELKKLKPEDARYQEITLEILAERCVQAVGLNFNRMPLAGYIGSDHLMHESDESIMAGKKMNTFSALSKHGYVVVDKTGELKFYSGHGLKPEKYGYVFARQEEIVRLHLVEKKESSVVTDHYKELYQALSPDVKADKQKVKESKQIIDERIQQIEQKLKENKFSHEELMELFKPLKYIQDIKVAKLLNEIEKLNKLSIEEKPTVSTASQPTVFLAG